MRSTAGKKNGGFIFRCNLLRHSRDKIVSGASVPCYILIFTPREIVADIENVLKRRYIVIKEF